VLTLKAVEARRVRQILVVLKDEKEREAVAGIVGERLVIVFQATSNKYTSEIIAANRLKSRDILL